VLGFGQSAEPIRWEIKLGVFLVPVLIYGLLMFGKTFPESEATTAGVSMSESMKTIGLVGFALVAGLVGLLLQNEIPALLKPKEGAAPDWHKFVGWAAAGVLWLVFWVATKFAIGSIIIAFIYLMHALVGYVELGTDSWITNITTRVLANETNALLAFIWTNVLMCFLRFFAGPIVHKINPVGLLFVSAVLGTLGLWLLGQNFTNSVWPWMAAVTVYALGKTFYWPTLLGVISERFPKGGALALGISGGVGMMCAGLIGAPGIGYKQDYFAVEKLKASDGTATYDRYMARGEDGKPSTKPFPVLTLAAPDKFTPIAGLDNAKFGVLKDHTAKLDAQEKKAKGEKYKEDALMTTLEKDLATLKKNEEAGKPVEAKLKKNPEDLQAWWLKDGLPNYATDKDKLMDADLYGSKQALLYTAIVPAILAVGFLLLILYFAATGGYKVIHLEAPRPYDPNRNVGAPADQWGR
jgi:hypothetical protein